MAAMDIGDENLPPPNHSWPTEAICSADSRSSSAVRNVLTDLNTSATEDHNGQQNEKVSNLFMHFQSCHIYSIKHQLLFGQPVFLIKQISCIYECFDSRVILSLLD